MNHHATELLARQRIADWHNEADGSRLVRSTTEARPVSRPARQVDHTDPHGRPLTGLRGPIGRLTGWLGQVRMVAQRLAMGK